MIIRKTGNHEFGMGRGSKFYSPAFMIPFFCNIIQRILKIKKETS
jgi:hypothetical protein